MLVVNIIKMTGGESGKLCGLVIFCNIEGPYFSKAH
jgi:hypothetical protein